MAFDSLQDFKHEKYAKYLHVKIIDAELFDSYFFTC
jgi:hypothetical protein